MCMWHKISNKSDNKNISNDTYTVTGRGSYKYIVLLFKLIEQKKNVSHVLFVCGDSIGTST